MPKWKFSYSGSENNYFETCWVMYYQARVRECSNNDFSSDKWMFEWESHIFNKEAMSLKWDKLT